MIESGADVPGVDVLLSVHILFGVVALLAGVGAITTKKGGYRHNTAGKAYALSMGAVVLTAVPLAVWTEDWFLFAIAVFSGYLVFGGYRIIWRRRAGLTEATPLDYLGHGTMIVAGAAMVGVGAWQTVTGSPGLAPALAVFGAIGAGFAVGMLRRLQVPPAEQSPWVQAHIGFMGGAYIATVTATVTVNLTIVPPLVRWLGPTAVGVPLIVYGTQKYTPRFTPGG
ncbi:hypothetical protein [Halovenus marina]|uniref:hypothetical protein n=1 Tax=Halovenus marina TaxID=3396621 RepID=UPI003F56079F